MPDWCQGPVLRAMAVFCIAIVPGCALLTGERTRAPEDPFVDMYRVAMADFSTCVTAVAPALRRAAQIRLEQSAIAMQAVTRASNPDHFYMTDRVTAARDFCAGP